MDVIKTEPEVDPLTIQTSDSTDVEEKKPVTEELNLLNVSSTEVKTELKDYWYALPSEIKCEDTPLPDNLPVVKREAEMFL
ncbi:uncharacterized protein [Periplaneta americana]|uniref:uncharacterized protein isoform X2 n=1 Tax=Periplaneta americana TaxID=6978 RepID=UPI0037E8E1CD